MRGFATNHAADAMGKRSRSARFDSLGHARLALLVDPDTCPFLIARLLQGAPRLAENSEALTMGEIFERWSLYDAAHVKMAAAVLKMVHPPSTSPRPEALPPLPERWGREHALVYEFFRNCDVRGTDVRLSLGQFYRAHAWPRQPINTLNWKWKVVQRYKYKLPQHINVLELRAYFNYLRLRARSHWLHRTRFGGKIIFF